MFISFPNNNITDSRQPTWTGEKTEKPSFITIYLCSTLNWVDISLVQSGEIPADRVVVRDNSAVCRWSFRNNKN